MSPELIGILGVGAALAGLIVTAVLWISGWLRDVDRRLERLEGLIEGSGLFAPANPPKLLAIDSREAAPNNPLQAVLVSLGPRR